MKHRCALFALVWPFLAGLFLACGGNPDTIVNLSTIPVPTPASDASLRVCTWDGYITPEEIDAVNAILREQGYAYTVELVTPFLEGADDLYRMTREGHCDIIAATLFFINMQNGRLAELLQPIDIHSPRLTNYPALLPSLTSIPMGMQDGKPLYIPWGGGVYGFWADMSTLTEDELPTSVADLWDPKWKGKISLNITQPWYNVGLTLMALGYPPFYLNTLILEGKRNEAIELANSQVEPKLAQLYRQAGHFWRSGPEFQENLSIVSSWGIEIAGENARGGQWKLIEFKEGNLVWLDTLNFVKGLSGKKLEAAEIVANYFIGKDAQTRIVNVLSVVAASTLAESNPLVESNPNFFANDRFVPPYDVMADNLMQGISDRALQGVGIEK